MRLKLIQKYKINYLRQAIIKGIRISYKGDGSIWLQNNMKWPVFVTSGYLDEQCGGMKLDKVHKLYGHAKLKVIQHLGRSLFLTEKFAF